ncbi:MAG: ABC transporter substrate-binding protein [Alphaproteobacteria bacterium]|nr:ABC transporter substrate-binding protein [Alphaproteobacteria bacterium]MCB9696440.1 ABC transporter substrate-binding protein [Alphaproteobacteria bacterium]
MSPASSLLLLSSWFAPADAGMVQVAVVVSDELDAYREPTEAFLAALGQQARVYNLHGRASEASQVANQLKASDPDVVFCVGAKAAYTVKRLMPSTPLVYATLLDPERYGIVGNQVTGVTMDVEPVTFLSQFTGFFPDVQQIGVIRGEGTSDERIAAMSAAAEELGRELVVVEVDSPRGVRRAFADLAQQGVDALWLPPDRHILTTSGYRTLSEEARRRHLPVLVDTRSMVEAGGLFTMVPDPVGVGEQAVALVHQILDGASPAVLPAEDPQRLLVVLNLRTLRESELEVDRLLLDFVDVTIE